VVGTGGRLRAGTPGVRSTFEELSEGMQWSDVRAEDREPAAATWLGIARQIAAAEGRTVVR
jgi:hypothetical protein